MWQFILRRLGYMIFTVWVVSLISFAVIQLPPGDFVTTMVGRLAAAGGSTSVPQLEQQLREQYGLDQPVYVQYVKWMEHILLDGRFIISFLAVLFIWVVALPIGIYSAVNKYTWGDYLATFVGYIGLAVPHFLMALVVMYVSYRYLGKATFGLFSPEYAAAPWSWDKAWVFSNTCGFR